MNVTSPSERVGNTLFRRRFCVKGGGNIRRETACRADLRPFWATADIFFVQVLKDLSNAAENLSNAPEDGIREPGDGTLKNQFRRTLRRTLRRTPLGLCKKRKVRVRRTFRRTLLQPRHPLYGGVNDIKTPENAPKRAYNTPLCTLKTPDFST